MGTSSPYRSLADWPAHRAFILANSSAHTWKEIFDNCLMTRLNSRYLDPIRWIQERELRQGEGFTILTIQCALIEFLAALRLGFRFERGNYKHGDDFRYWDSKCLFVDFLRHVAPFADHFTARQALKFYVDVRCGLIHEAQTKGQWVVKSACGSDRMIDFTTFTVNRDIFSDKIAEYLDHYQQELSGSAPLQVAFIRKFDHLFSNTAESHAATEIG
ncbi:MULTISPECIES: hypothetical protein [Rhizobium]|uniref:Uncharacterized protein n=1 Tax=Rhizobium esperanzae TaxID=1967781 RepID=A0A7W6XZ55_9HYPH|nr:MULTISPECIES: hypothetical protein [Rhizobium]MBB4443496.1 hypothetical protein [Rhizobium esperanzae]MBY5400006.1 hypothetical protein [Rhizobium leguminosarum]MBY5419270.1 hypothetical protein [Rhizobium leguminosarum]MDH6202844.1 hypothetical protein [Rhizobium leguminosarum]